MPSLTSEPEVKGQALKHNEQKTLTFRVVDFTCEEAENPCDFFLDLVQSFAHEASNEGGDRSGKRLSELDRERNGSNSSVNCTDKTAVIHMSNGALNHDDVTLKFKGVIAQYVFTCYIKSPL